MDRFNPTATTRARRRVLLLALALLSLFAVSGAGATSAFASHERALNLSWKQTGPKQADFTLTAAFRRSGFSGTAADGQPQPGDIIEEDIGETGLSFGDGDSTGVLRFLVTSVDVGNDFLQGIGLQPGSDTDTTITHDYSGASGNDFPAQVSGCCSISSLNNNADGNYGVQSQVRFGQTDESPVSSLPVIVGVGNTGVQSFTVPASDNDVPGTNTFSFRAPTAVECGGCASDNPPGLSIDPVTGKVTWDTTGVSEGLYYANVIVEERGGGAVKSTTAVQYLINVAQGGTTNQAPSFVSPTPANGTEYTVAPGNTVSFDLAASDPDAGDTVTIVGSSIPAGASYTPTAGNPGTGAFSWTPSAGQEGDYIVNFSPNDDKGASGDFRSYVIHVRSTEGPAGSASCSDGVDNDGDGQIDAADADCTPVTPPSGEIAYAITKKMSSSNIQRLVSFSVTNPGTLLSDVPITGLVNGEQIQGLDYRPADGNVYLVGRKVRTSLAAQSQRLYRVNLATGAATIVSTLSRSLEEGSFGVDFNPVADRLRITSTKERNLRVVPSSGAVTIDGVLRYAAGDKFGGRNPNVVGSAYSNNVAGATSTTLYDIDTVTKSLVTQDANAGTLSTVGTFGSSFTDDVGFDISGASGIGYTTMVLASGKPRVSALRTINLTTGKLTLIGKIGTGRILDGLTIVPSSAPAAAR